MDKFKKPDRRSYSNPIESYNLTFTTESIIYGNKNFEADGRDITSAGRPAYKFDPATVKFVPQIVDGNIVDLIDPVSPFELLTHIRFKDNYHYALAYVVYQHFEKDVPYIRVADDYYKNIDKKNHWGVETNNLKPWKKTTIVDDYGKGMINRIPKYDDFTIDPNNINYRRVVDGMYNLYEPFPWKEYSGDVTISDIPVSATFMAHVFGDQADLGYKYMKVLYELPKQILPVLCLVSKERETGKTSFIKWIEIIFANNTALISPEDMSSAFNAHYAYKNIICIDETIIEKQAGVERIKSLTTQSSIQVNQKNVSQYSIPFYGKIILATNKATDFMRIDMEEIRFWVRKLDRIKEDNKIYGDFYERLIGEVPKFLKYLRTKIDLEKTKSRMIFSEKDLQNDQLEMVKENSRPGLYKEIKLKVSDWFKDNSTEKFLYMRLKDIKDIWFDRDNRVSTHYIKKVLNEDFEMDTLEIDRYHHFGSSEKKKSTPFKFDRVDFLTEKEIDFLENREYSKIDKNYKTPF